MSYTVNAVISTDFPSGKFVRRKEKFFHPSSNELVDWIRSLPEDFEFETGDGYGCPVARYYQQKNTNNRSRISIGLARLNDTQYSYALPDHVTSFVMWFDETFHEYESVSPSDVLIALESSGR